MDVKEWWLDQGIEQIKMIESANMSIKNKIVLELGTGWQPIIPILFYLKDAKKIILIDSQRLIDKKLLVSLINNMIKYRIKLSTKLNLNEKEIDERLYIKPNQTIEFIFDKFNMKYLAPYDARNTTLSDSYVDIITSRAVLEHIPKNILEEILGEFKRILNNDGVMCHIIDNSDHWEHKDKSISRLNFLKYEELIWRLTSINPLDYQNRMRHYEYMELFLKTGFKAVADYSTPDENVMNDLKKMKLCKKYQNVTYKELAILTSKLIHKKIDIIG